MRFLAFLMVVLPVFAETGVIRRLDGTQLPVG